MKIVRIIIVSAILFSLFGQCTERIDVKVDSTYTRLVVEGYVSTDTMSHFVKLTTTRDYFYNNPSPGVPNAIVRIDDGETITELKESADQPGKYLTDPDFYGEPGKTYTLMISNVDVDGDGILEEYIASSILNPVNEIDSIALEHIGSNHFSVYQVLVYAWDSPEKDYYAFKVHKNNKLMTDTLYELIVQDDEFFNGNYTYGIPSQFFDQYKEEEVIHNGDTITFEINGITEEYYNYVTEALSEIYTQTPLFSGPPANISTNVSNGAVGFFVAYSVNRCSTIAEIE